MSPLSSGKVHSCLPTAGLILGRLGLPYTYYSAREASVKDTVHIFFFKTLSFYMKTEILGEQLIQETRGEVGCNSLDCYRLSYSSHEHTSADFVLNDTVRNYFP